MTAKEKMALQIQQKNGTPQPRPSSRMAVVRQDLMSPAVTKIIQERIGQQRAPQFISSVLDLIGADNQLSQCNPQLVIKECLKAAALNLPISKSLGFAWVIPYKDWKQSNALVPQFQIGYKGIIQLSLRTCQYRHLNADAIYEGEIVNIDRIKGILEISGDASSEKITGFFAYFKLLNGFEKGLFWTVEKMTQYCEQYSPGYNTKNKKGEYTSRWRSDFKGMGIKTMLKQLLSKYGPMTIEMQQALEYESEATDNDSLLTPTLSEDITVSDSIIINESEDEPKEITQLYPLPLMDLNRDFPDEFRMALQQLNIETIADEHVEPIKKRVNMILDEQQAAELL